MVVRKLRRHLGKGYKHVHIIYFYNRMDETDKHRSHGLHIGVLRIIISLSAIVAMKVGIHT